MSEALIEKATAIVQQKITDAKKATPGPYAVEKFFWKVGSTRGQPDCYWQGIDARGPIHGYVAQIQGEDSEAVADAQNFANHGPDVMVPLWEWMLETLGKWRATTEMPSSDMLYTVQKVLNIAAESLARAICGGGA